LDIPIVTVVSFGVIVVRGYGVTRLRDTLY
jgi:hypothetical protein